MDALAHCRAMAAFCRQRAMFHNEDDGFWIREAAAWDKLLSDYIDAQPESWPDLGPMWPSTVSDDIIYPLRYRCPVDVAERDHCRWPCRIMLEYVQPSRGASHELADFNGEKGD